MTEEKSLNLLQKLCKRMIDAVAWRVLFISIVVNLAGISVGMTIGYPSPTAVELRQNYLSDATFPLFTSFTFIGAALGSLLTFFPLEFLGRKSVIILNTLIKGFGWFLLVVANNAAGLIAGRFIIGIGLGVYSIVIPIYVVEIAHHTSKGLYSSFFGLYLTIGILIVFVLGNFLIHQWLSMVPLFLLMIMAFIMLFQPESPTWLIKRNLNNKAKSVLNTLRKENEDVLEEIEKINGIILAQKGSIKDKFKLILEKYHLKAFGVGMFYMALAQFSGFPALGSYASVLFRGTTLLKPNVASLIIPLNYLIGNIVIFFLIDRAGRKILSIVTSAIIGACYISAAIYFKLHIEGDLCMGVRNGTQYTIHECGKYIILWPMITFAVCGIAYTMGMATIKWLYLGELFPLRVKIVISGSGAVVLWLSTFLIIFAFPHIQNLIGLSGLLTVLAIINIISAIYVLVFVPETKAKPYSEIEKLFKEHTFFCLPDKLEKKLSFFKNPKIQTVRNDVNSGKILLINKEYLDSSIKDESCEV